MNVLIVDDRPEEIDNLFMLLKGKAFKTNALFTATDTRQARLLLKNNEIDLVFLDVEMPGETGFDLMDEDYMKRSPITIFVTSYDHYAIRAIRAGAFDFLVKPVDQSDFDACMDRVLHQPVQQGVNRQVEAMSAALDSNDPVRRIAVASRRETLLIDTEDLIWIKSDNSYCELATNRHGRIVVSKSIKHFEDMLQTSGFCRVHNSFLVNIHHIGKIVKEHGRVLYMSDGKEVPVSQARIESFETSLRQNVRTV